MEMVHWTSRILTNVCTNVPVYVWRRRYTCVPRWQAQAASYVGKIVNRNPSGISYGRTEIPFFRISFISSNPRMSNALHDVTFAHLLSSLCRYKWKHLFTRAEKYDTFEWIYNVDNERKSVNQTWNRSSVSESLPSEIKISAFIKMKGVRQEYFFSKLKCELLNGFWNLTA